MRHSPSAFAHPRFSRRTALQAGASAILGLGVGELAALRAADGSSVRHAAAGSVIYIFLSGGLAQQDSFDLKPDAAENIRGEFKPIATRTPGIRICEHLPLLAQRSHLWALCRSLTHPSNDHSRGHAIMLTGRSDPSPGFNPSAPTPTDWPAIAAIAGAVTRPRNNLPPAVVLAGTAHSQHGAGHPRSVRRHHGSAARSVVLRDVGLRAEGLRRLSRIRVRPSGTAVQAAAQGVRSARSDAAAGCRYDAPRRPARPAAAHRPAAAMHWSKAPTAWPDTGRMRSRC